VEEQSAGYSLREAQAPVARPAHGLKLRACKKDPFSFLPSEACNFAFFRPRKDVLDFRFTMAPDSKILTLPSCVLAYYSALYRRLSLQTCFNQMGQPASAYCVELSLVPGEGLTRHVSDWLTNTPCFYSLNHRFEAVHAHLYGLLLHALELCPQQYFVRLFILSSASASTPDPLCSGQEEPLLENENDLKHAATVQAGDDPYGRCHKTVQRS